MYPYQNYGYQPNYQQPNYMQRQYAQQPSQMPQNQQQVFTPIQTPPPMETPIQDMLIDKESGVVYVKTADGMGQTQTDYFRFEAINADGSPIKVQEPTPQVDFSQFIKKEDLEKFGFVTIEQYNALAQRLEQIQKRLEGAKQNVGQQPKQPEARVQMQ